MIGGAWKPLNTGKILIPRFFYVDTHTNRNMAQEEPHIGHLIRAELARQERTVSWLARKLCYSRQNIYHLFESKWIASDVLMRVSDVMHHNFFRYYSDYWDSKNV